MDGQKKTNHNLEDVCNIITDRLQTQNVLKSPKTQKENDK